MKLILSFLFIFSFSTSFAQDLRPEDFRLLTPSEMKRIMGNFPAPGSRAYQEDFQAIFRFQDTRTDEQCRKAASEESVYLENLFAGPRGPLSNSEARRLTPSFVKIYAEAGANIYLAKKLYRRPRPYITDPNVVPCIGLENSEAYPSGHATIARVFARILSHLYPAKARAFMKRADEVAFNRVLGGVHHPSDVEAGKKLGDALAEIMLRDQDLFQ